MKKITMMALLCACTVIFSSCSKEDGNYSLNGTVWIQNDVGNDQIGELKFQETTFTLYYTSNGKTEGGNGTYTYDAPNLVMKADGQTITGVIEDSKIKVAGQVA